MGKGMRPNILYLHSHDTGRYVQPYGYAVPTPQLQGLAESGVLFRQCFCANPTCSPSRAALLTGESPHNNGMLGLAHRGFAMNYDHHLVRFLRGHGYETALAGGQHEAHDESAVPAWQKIGYERHLGGDHDGHLTAGEFLRTVPRRPFFLSVGLFETHREFPVEHPEVDARYCRPPAPLLDTPETREDMARFIQSARVLDGKMGAVLAALAESGLADETLVICTTDHGIAFPRMKCNLHDTGTGVMLLMRGPGGFAGGKVVEAMVGQVDVFPTLCELLGVAVPEWVQGESLLPLVRGEVATLHEELFSEVNYHAAYEPMRAVRTARWKYIRRYDGRTAPVLPNCDDGLSKDVWLAHGWRELAPPEEMLYDLVFDPNESANLAGDPQHAGTLAEMRGRLARWMTATDDPLLRHGGTVPPPLTALVNAADGFSPQEQPLAPSLAE